MSYCEVRYEHFKREDSTNSIIVTLFDDDQVTPIVPNSSHSWSAKVAKEEDEEKYVGEYPVQISGNEIILTSDRLVRLPRGTYLMELWENNNGKVTIYPSADFIQFTIHKNATDTIGHVDPTTDINKIIDDLHKAGQNIKLGTVTTGAPGSSVVIRQRLENGQNLLDFTIPRGDKGDGFTDYGNITESGDLNDYKRTGVADIQAAMANKPAGYKWAWGVLKVFAPDNGSHHIVQEWYPSGISTGTMFFRYYTVGRGGKWGAWQKMGEASSAPSPGLLYSGSFTVKTGSTPAWGYKEIPVGDIDGDTLTVTLTIHQTAGAKLDQICMALYDSKITKPLATYAYPATEQTNTITIVDKWPDKDAKLLFYSNDKTTNVNTTVEFSDVTIVGS